MKRVLITGATGFIGSFLLKNLLDSSYQIAIIVRKESSFKRIIESLERVQIIYSDYTNFDESESEILKFDPEIVYHLGWAGVDNTMHNNENILNVNIQSTLSLVNIILKGNVKTFIGLGSQAEYGPCNCVISEKQQTNPTTLYGIAKLTAYNIMNYNFKQNNIRFVWLRLFSSYGPADNENWLIPYLIKSLSEGVTPELTKGEQIWDYIYIDDVVSAIVSCGENDKTIGIYNLGSGIGYQLKSVIENIRDIINPAMSLVFGTKSYAQNQIMVLQADNTKLRLDTGWNPSVQLSEGLESTVTWFLNNK